ncbi:hypothetical protein GUITHDRAFT_113327 [Guillardia theta CCMP2712]|uniref:Uncharacterized protein n=1 Tax=Guillardia theta (strain CCMP2712) TaxID=905079 RepID=L1IWC8_GUITC|nr:hypothetical protein GUITHDRAFT_113327 [Guillardia theta CCMP2712]EKX40541.1 hypothetical protein GUITHDRAFT_113327 [Guillardia theta CCMP2712]|eukprot:XP_005827521.1 hypothetical protein GUITHDRAFT_113327 [Guillardia theta CCMP2712]
MRTSQLLILPFILLSLPCLPTEVTASSIDASKENKLYRVAILVPSSPWMHPELKRRIMENLRRVPRANPKLYVRIFIDAGPLQNLPGMLSSIDLRDFDYIMWMDADIVEFPFDLPSKLIFANPTGATAPLVLIEEPGPMGPNQFYDTTAFTLKGKSDLYPDLNVPYVEGRSVERLPPYVPYRRDGEELVEMDGIGTCYVLPVEVFTVGNATYIDHPRLTEHWSVIKKVHEMGRKVLMHLEVRVRHANLPLYGSDWHRNSN